MDFLTARWENIVMANYAVPQDVLLPYLPNGCALDLYHGDAYVSLVGFMFKNTKLFKVCIPFLGTFEEINLRFYVVRKEGDKIKRGVVFINETIPYLVVAWVANKLYKEHYSTIPTRNSISINLLEKKIEYNWQIENVWNSLYVEADTRQDSMEENSFEEYIFEHYYGYTKINAVATEEYTIEHSRWKLNKINNYKIQCKFDQMYGSNFSFLNNSHPQSIFLAEGSSVAVKWKRERLTIA